MKATGKETLVTLGKGNIEVQSRVSKTHKRVTLMDVWYVPEINRNLFSVLASQDRNQNSKFLSSSAAAALQNAL